MTDISVSGSIRQSTPRAGQRVRLPTQWLGVAPFFIFALMFLILPTTYLILGRPARWQWRWQGLQTRREGPRPS
jgi:hypothetical protein